MAARKLSPKTGSNTTAVPSKRSLSGILPNLPIQISETLLANAKPQSLAEREVLFDAGDVADGCYRLEQGLLKVSIASPQGDERILTILGPGSIVGELAIIDGLLTYRARVPEPARVEHPSMLRALVGLRHEGLTVLARQSRRGLEGGAQ